MSIALKTTFSHTYFLTTKLFKKFKCNFNTTIYNTFSINSIKHQNLPGQAEVFRKESYIAFSELMRNRRAQASRSILVQVNSVQSCSELYHYCSDHGNILTMNHYATGSEPMNLVIVEFDAEAAVQRILTSSCHANDSDTVTIPVRSPFLWFRAAAQRNSQKPKLKPTDVLNSCLNSEYGTTAMDQTEMNTALTTATNISEQMVLLYKNSFLGETGIRLRFLACKQIELALVGMFPFAEAIPFGSSVNSFGKEGCDLDIVLTLDSHKKDASDSRLVFHSKAATSNERSQTQRHMECIADMLQLFLPGCAHVRRILQARVPIIKYNQEHSGLECDLSMTNLTGVYMSDLLYTLGCVDPRVRPLVFTIRRWAQNVGLTASNPGRWITNFSLTLLVLAFLQRVNILPTINTLMKLADASDKVVTDDGINCSFLHNLDRLPESEKPNTDSLESLLLQFFEHYSAFDFNLRGVSLNEGKDILKPEHSALYIMNPLERHYNVSKNVSIEELERLRIELRNAAWSLESQDSSKVMPDSNWGLLAILASKNRRNPFNSLPTQIRLVEIKGLFDNSEKNAANMQSNENLEQTIINLTAHSDVGDKRIYKSSIVKKEIKNIKLETAKRIKKIKKNSFNTNTNHVIYNRTRRR